MHLLPVLVSLLLLNLSCGTTSTRQYVLSPMYTRLLTGLRLPKCSLQFAQGSNNLSGRDRIRAAAVPGHVSRKLCCRCSTELKARCLCCLNLRNFSALLSIPFIQL